MNLIELINRNLGRYLPPEKDEPKTLHKAMRYSVFSPGKRLRPIIVMESSIACASRQKDALACACAVELVHTYSLIHDDLPAMDDDDYRRGLKTCHKRFGEAIAILAGDALLTLAFNILTELPAAKCAEVIKELSLAIGSYGMAGGQAADIEYKLKDKDAGIIDYINRCKTAKLFEVSAKIGAISAGASEKEIRALASYGINLGMAFQTADDIADDPLSAGSSERKKMKFNAAAFIKKSKGALKIFGNRAEALGEIADRVLSGIGGAWNE